MYKIKFYNYFDCSVLIVPVRNYIILNQAHTSILEWEVLPAYNSDSVFKSEKVILDVECPVLMVYDVVLQTSRTWCAWAWWTRMLTLQLPQWDSACSTWRPSPASLIWSRWTNPRVLNIWSKKINYYVLLYTQINAKHSFQTLIVVYFSPVLFNGCIQVYYLYRVSTNCLSILTVNKL